MSGYIRLPRESEDDNDARAIGARADSPVYSHHRRSDIMNKPRPETRGATLSSILRVTATVVCVVTLAVNSVAVSVAPEGILPANITAVALSLLLHAIVCCRLAVSRHISNLAVCENCHENLTSPRKRSRSSGWCMFVADIVMALFAFSTSIPAIIGIGAPVWPSRDPYPASGYATGVLTLILSYVSTR